MRLRGPKHARHLKPMGNDPLFFNDGPITDLDIKPKQLVRMAVWTALIVILSTVVILTPTRVFALEGYAPPWEGSKVQMLKAQRHLVTVRTDAKPPVVRTTAKFWKAKHRPTRLHRYSTPHCQVKVVAWKDGRKRVKPFAAAEGWWVLPKAVSHAKRVLIVTKCEPVFYIATD